MIKKRITELISQLEREANYFDAEINKRLIHVKKIGENHVVDKLKIRVEDRKQIINQLKNIIE